MRRPITATVLSILAGFAFSGPAMAGSYDTSAIRDDAPMTRQTPAFKKADRNQNGLVSVREARIVGITADEAQAADAGDDGKLSESDWRLVESHADDSGMNEESDKESDDSEKKPDYTDKTDKSGTDKKVYD